MSKTSYLCVAMLYFEYPMCQAKFTMFTRIFSRNLQSPAVFSAEFCSFRKIWLIRISAENFVQPAEFKKKIRLRGLFVPRRGN